MNPKTSRVMKHNPIRQGAMSPTQEGKVAWVSKKSSYFQLSRCPSCYLVNASFIVSCAPSFVNLRTRFLLRGRVLAPRVMISLMTFIKALIKDQIHRLISFLSKPKSKFKWIQIEFVKQIKKTHEFEISNSVSWVDLSSMGNQELLVQVSSILESFDWIPSNSSPIQTLDLLWFFIWNPFLIWISSYG
jgi:hypothetical protein